MEVFMLSLVMLSDSVCSGTLNQRFELMDKRADRSSYTRSHDQTLNSGEQSGQLAMLAVATRQHERLIQQRI